MDVKEIKANPRKKILQFSVWAIIAMALTSFVTVADGFLWEGMRERRGW
ncbi:MAG: hypothetical protein HFG71_13930 [Hungatella sp.]|jgi:hypothetical protein|nr:hypothetical protein [Hungatella sp.]